jgi:ABC-type branched-subunit amino acid transport system ATPase component
VKLGLFVLSSAIAGLGGVLYASYNGAVTELDFPPLVGVVWLAVAVTFGVRRPGFAVVAGLVYAMAPQVIGWFTTSTVVPSILFGLGCIHATRPRTQPHPKLRQEGTDRGPSGLNFGGVLVVSDIRGGYDEAEVLHGVDLALPAGSLVALLGPNGAGKSTLCGVLGGTLTPTAGSVRLDGADITGQPPHWRARQRLLVAPETRGVFPGLTVEENLRLTLAPPEIARAFERFPRLEARRRQPAGVLSGGEQQILTLAALLVRPPRVLIADEPLLGLAPQVAADVLAALVELRDAGVAVLVVEEKARDLLGLADQLVIVELGRVVWAGPPDHADAEQQLLTTYLGNQPRRVS